MSHSRAGGQWALSLVTNLLVLSALGGVAWWGHHSHWSFGGDAKALASGETVPEAAVTPERRFNPLVDSLPPIRFASAQGARDCGITIAAAGLKSMDEFVRAHGVVGYDETKVAQLSSRVPGVVCQVEKHLGEHVQQGDVLAIVDSAEVGEAKARLIEAAVLYDLKKQTVERLTRAKDSVSGREIAEAEAAFKLAGTQRFNAIQKLINLGFGVKADEIQKTPLEALREQLHLLGLPASMGPETSSNNLIPLLAPFSGTVTRCVVVRGEYVDPSRELYVVADTRRMWLNLNVRQDQAQQLKIGAPVLLNAGVPSRPVAGTLTWIGTEIDPRTRTVHARADVANPLLDESQDETGRRLLQSGRFGDAQILVQRRPETVVVPNEALHWQWEIGRQIVFVAGEDGMTFAPRVVEKGMVRDGDVQILSGLEKGERVVTLGSRILSAELSDLLQPEIGDNSTANRSFDPGHSLSQNPG